MFNDYFCGNKISDYGKENGRVDYATLAKSFDAVLNNEIIKFEPDCWTLENGTDYDSEKDEWTEIYQYYIVSQAGANILEEYTNEIVYYNEQLDMYLWAVTHYGTSWDYVLTDIPCKKS